MLARLKLCVPLLRSGSCRANEISIYLLGRGSTDTDKERTDRGSTDKERKGRSTMANKPDWDGLHLHRQIKVYSGSSNSSRRRKGGEHFEMVIDIPKGICRQL